MSKEMMIDVRQPLEGIRVLELGMYHAGPGGGAILGDLGAEVIKIEKPRTGDPIRKTRIVGMVSLEASAGVNIWNEGSNRNKKSVTIDLSKEEGRTVAYRLVRKSDVFLTSLRRTAIEDMKMTYPVLADVQPRLIYAWVSGYGPAGPDSNVRAFDFQGQARSGMMFSVGEADSIPLVSQFAIVDQATSIMASHAIITALLMRERFGTGQEVHLSILSSALYLHYANVLTALLSGHEVPRPQRAKEYPLRNYYKCSDDRWFIITIPEARDDLWPLFCQTIECPDLEKDTRFETAEKRRTNAEQLVSLLDEVFATRPRDEWLKLLVKYDFPAAPVHRHTELKDDLQILQNDYIVGFDHPKLGRVQIPGYPIHFSRAHVGTESAAPELGQDTEAVLAGLGAYTQKEIARLRHLGVI